MRRRAITAACGAAFAFAFALVVAGCVAPAANAVADGDTWTALFDGNDLAGMVPVRFGGDGDVHIDDGRLLLEQGSPLTGVTFTATLPESGYELEVVGSRLMGNDFFCALTFPVPGGCLSLVLGGWGGAVCGLSCLDGEDAAHNGTRRLRHFTAGRDYRVAVRVTADAVRASIDGEELLAADPRAHRCTVRAEVELCQPLGLCSYATRASFASVRWRRLPASPPRQH